MRLIKSQEDAEDEKPQKYWLFGPSFVQLSTEVKHEEEELEQQEDEVEENLPLVFSTRKRARTVSKKIELYEDIKFESRKTEKARKKGAKKAKRKAKVEKAEKMKVGRVKKMKVESAVGDERMKSGGRVRRGSLPNVKIEDGESSPLSIVKVENGESMKVKRGALSTNRWTQERYARAEITVVELMRENGGPRLMRRELRDMARKHIGDTGLLDHLLKHMAGKVVGDRGERFMRGYNEDGVMFYWLESASGDEANGFCRCNDGCAEEIKKLKDGIANLNRELEELRSLKDLEEIAWKEKYEKLLNSNVKLEAEMSKMNSSAQELKDNYERLLEKNAKLEAEMAGMNSSFQGLKDQMLLKEEKKLEDEEEEAEEMEMVEDAKRDSDSEGGDENENGQLNEHSKAFSSSQLRRPHLKLPCRGQVKSPECEGDLPQLSSSESDQLTSQQILD